MKLNISRGRQISLICILLVLFGILAGDLFKLQVIETKKYKDIVSNVSSRTSPIKAARGEIVDCNGKKLVFNEQGYSIIFDAAFFPDSENQQERNRIINNLIRLFTANHLEWKDTLPLVFGSNGKIKFKPDSEVLIKKLKSRDMLNLNEYASAQDCFDALIEKYELGDFGEKDARNIASVLYEMERTYFSISAPFTFADKVPEKLVSLIKERSDFFKGVDVEVVPVRSYTDGTIAPHILGMTGLINAEEYAQLKEKGYNDTDEIGKSGMELAAEDYLKGKNGEKTVYTDADGNRTTKITKQPEQGDTVVLTIDSGMQKVVQDALEKVVIEENSFHTVVPNAGACVVLSCKDASVLASASYPTYNISTYGEHAQELNTAKGSPLWNRALMSTYACGSTAKPSVAIAALEEKIIDEDFTVYCNGSYTYMGQHFKCEQAHENLYVNVVHAIDESCNTFFLKVGDMLGIDKMNEYRTLLGLGSKTGVELNEAVGVLDSPEYRTSINQTWLPGYTVQSAIGQAGNLWTPIQLANYVNTIANGGVRYRAHLIKSVKSFDYSQTKLDNGPEVVVQTGISKETIDIVKRGMLEVGTTGYCAQYFWHLPVKVACKTGTSQELRPTGNGYTTKINNGFLIAFAPYDNPQIAVAVVGEGLVSGKYLSPVVAAAIEYWLGASDSAEGLGAEEVLLP